MLLSAGEPRDLRLGIVSRSPGSVRARPRSAENATDSSNADDVLVIEHGYLCTDSQNLHVRAPSGLARGSANKILTDNASDPRDNRGSRQYNMTSAPQPGLNNRTVPLGMGFCVGGSSAINGMAVMRGTEADYAIWAKLGEEGSTWHWEGMLPYYRKVCSDPKFLAGVAAQQLGYSLRASGRGVCGGLQRLLRRRSGVGPARGHLPLRLLPWGHEPQNKYAVRPPPHPSPPHSPR